MKKDQLVQYITQAITFLYGGLFILFPVFVLTQTTDAFMLPKELLLAGVTLVSLVLFAAQMIISQKVVFRKSAFDFPILLVLLSFFLSAIFSLNRWDSLIAYITVLFAGLSYFILVNTIRKNNSLVFLVSALLFGGCLSALIAIFSYFKVYPLPFAFTHVQSFTTLGTPLEQLVFFIFLLPIAIKESLPLIKGETEARVVSFGAAALILIAGIIVTGVQLLTTQKPVLLPFDSGFQVAFAAISQDAGRLFQGFLFGSGFGNFTAAFTKFKQATFNTNPNWFVPFTQSSSLLLELLATTGILGFLSFLFLLFHVVAHFKKKIQNPLFFSLVAMVAATLLLPFSFVGFTIFFLLLSLFTLVQFEKHPSTTEEFEFRFVALRKGMFSFQPYSTSEKKEYYKGAAYIIGAVFIIIAGFFTFYTTVYALANLSFQKSLVDASNNNGIQTYKDQVQAISLFPYQSAYYRIFSQTNIALANSLAASQPKGSSPSAQIQNTVVTLIQQGITAARNATTYAPQSVSNWQNLSSVYRSLFGFGQNAEQFAVLAAQQAIILDPTNPQEYVALGGIYYQLGQWDNSIRAFQQAATLKNDYANAYYNLGHAYEQKGDLQNALASYQAVQQLVGNDKQSSQQIAKEIAAVQAKLGSGQTQTSAGTQKPAANTPQEPLQVNQPTTQLPAQPTQIPVAGPSGNPTPSPTPHQ